MPQRFTFFLGIDPGLENIGSTLLDQYGNVIDASHIHTPKIASHSRWEKIASHFQEIPDCCACYEMQPPIISSSVSIALGYILCTVKPSYVVYLPPKKLKKWLVGSGLASKQDIITAVHERLKIVPLNDHVADSAACAMYAYSLFSG